jgi:hypothetical protein
LHAMTGRKKRSRTHRSSPRPFPSPSSKYRNIRKENWKKKKECQKHKRKSFILELLGQRRRRRRQCRSKGKKTYRITHPSLSSASFSSSACVDRVLKLGTRRPDSLLKRITYFLFFSSSLFWSGCGWWEGLIGVATLLHTLSFIS